jgi:hypothetical protein
VRGGLDDTTVDAALSAARDAHAANWKLGLRIREAVARDETDEETSAIARAHRIWTIQWLMIVSEISLGTAKSVVGLLEQRGASMHGPGAISRAISWAMGTR